MAERCGCYDQADDIVFGPPRPVAAEPEPRPYEHVLSDECEQGDLG